jgi:hypothetical protein
MPPGTVYVRKNLPAKPADGIDRGCPADVAVRKLTANGRATWSGEAYLEEKAVIF